MFGCPSQVAMLQATLRRGSRGPWGWLASAESIFEQVVVIQTNNQDETSPFSNQQRIYHTIRPSTWTDRLQSLSSLTQSPSSLPSPSLFPALYQPHTKYSSSAGDSKHDTASPLSPPPSGTWVDRLPASWLPYAHLSRIEKPIGTWLLAWPCFWSIALAAPPGALPNLYMLGLFGAGSVLLRGAGCTVNDLWDRDLDRKVERTRTRPLASGAVTPIQAVGWLGAQLTLGLGILVQLNGYSQALGASSLALVATYPLMKRITGWPQAFLGLTFNWGALLGWAAVRGSCDWSVVLPLYFGGIAWTLVYDTIYAHQDKKDDVAAGIKSTALTFGQRNRQYLATFAAINVACMAAAGHAAGCGMLYNAGLAAAAGHLGWQVATVDFDDEKDCGNKFRSNFWYGALIFAGITADRLLAAGVLA